MKSIRALLALVLGSIALLQARAAIYEQVSDLPHEDFDFIIVGGGVGGNVVASRLSENPRFQVLVLEAGPSHIGVLESEVPFLATSLFNTRYDWNYTSVPQVGLGGRTVYLPRGHILGGCSSTDFMIYTRSTVEDFDRWSKVTGDNGWSWNSLERYFKKHERLTPPKDNHDTQGQLDPSLHGRNGLLTTSLSGYPIPIDQMVVTAAQQLGGNFKFNLDISSGKPLGISYLLTNVDGRTGIRGSSANGYLAPQFLNRTNLHVLVNAEVSRLIQTAGKTPTFRSVEFRQAIGGTLSRLNATKEVILSAGSIGSSHIMLNSGIGATKALRAVGVKPLVNLPDVGENLMDKPVLAHGWIVNSNNTFGQIRDPANVPGELKLWQETGGGPFVNTHASMLGFFRMAKNVTLKPDLAAGPNTPHFQFLIANGLIVETDLFPRNRSYLGMSTIVTSPVSRGSLKINSSDPFQPPLIDPGFFKEKVDRVVMREAIKQATRFFSAPVWNDYIVAPSGGLENATTDEKLDEYITAGGSTFFHPSGTLGMSAKGAKKGVVDPDLRVKNIVGLRVVDASIFPIIPSGHIASAVYAVAERAADIIKAQYSDSHH